MRAPALSAPLKAYLAGSLFLVVAVALPQWLLLGRHAHHNYDLGVYAQAMHRIGPTDLNPWLSARRMHILNDHFEPILILVSPLAKVMDPAYAAMTVELTFVLLCPLPLLWLARRRLIAPGFASIGVLFLLLNRGIVSGVCSPVHPGTWAVLPIVMLGCSLFAGSRRGILLSILFLFLFREEFAFGGLMLGIAFYAHRRAGLGGALIAASVAWIAFVFWGRPLLLGPVYDHAGSRFATFFASPLAGILSPFSEWALSRRILEMLLPLIPIAIWMRRERTGPLWMALWFLVPMIAIRTLGEAWRIHYGAPVMAALLMALLPAGRIRSMPR